MWVNPIMAWILRSPLHGMMSGSLLLVMYTGKKSGRSYETPVNYVRSGNDLLTTSYRQRNWWRNLRGGVTANVLLKRKMVPVRCQVAETDEQVTAWLNELLAAAPQAASYLKIGKDEAGRLKAKDIAEAAITRVMVRFTPIV